MYKKVFIITTTSDKTGEMWRKGFLLNIGIQEDLRDKDNLFLFCHTTEKKSKEGITESEFEDTIFNHHKNIKTLNIYCRDGYTYLAEKTFRAISWVSKNLKFKHLLKCDDNKPPIHGMTTPSEADYSGVVMSRKREVNEEGKGWWTKHHQSQGLSPCRTSRFQKWAKQRNIKINTEYYDPSVYYSVWKPYILSSDFCKVITKHGKNYSDLYCEHLGGCEDHMIGKIWKDLQITYNLTIK